MSAAAVKSEYQQKKIFILVNKYFSASYTPPYVFFSFLYSSREFDNKQSIMAVRELEGIDVWPLIGLNLSPWPENHLTFHHYGHYLAGPTIQCSIQIVNLQKLHSPLFFKKNIWFQSE